MCVFYLIRDFKNLKLINLTLSLSHFTSGLNKKKKQD